MLKPVNNRIQLKGGHADMPDHLAPGVFVAEAVGGQRSIAGVATSTAAFLGQARRGPLLPTLVTSFAEFRRIYGGRQRPEHYLEDSVAGFFANGGARVFVIRIAGAGAARASRAAAGLAIEAASPGLWGNRLFAKITDSSTLNNGFRLQIAYWEDPTPDGVYPDPFETTGLPDPPPIIEEADNLAWDDEASPNYYRKRLDTDFALVRAVTSAPLSRRPTADFAGLTGGVDGSPPTAADYRGDASDPAAASGLAALEQEICREVALVVAPAAPQDAIAAIIEHCDQSRARFAIIDCMQGEDDAATLDRRKRWDSPFAAFYYPWIEVPVPGSAEPRLVPPSGHVAGVYARTDRERGVWKAPANDVLLGVIGLEFDTNVATQEILNPNGVNAIRNLPNRGIRVWGARTLSSNALWRYVSVQRLFIFLEQSIYEGMHWVVFEPNAEPLWEQVTAQIRLFLRSKWQSGALLGKTEEEAFFIACDRRTMSMDDLAQGRLVCEIGIAPVRPAEFVMFRMVQLTADALN